MKRRILALGVVMSLVFLPFRLLSETETDAVNDVTDVNQQRIVLTIDYGDGAQKRFPRIPWKKTMSVLDATLWAAKHPRGIDLETRGSQSFTLVTRIDDLKNGRGDAQNWIFRVNGKLGDKSCAVFSIDPGDRILWSFEKYQ